MLKLPGEAKPPKGEPGPKKKPPDGDGLRGGERAACAAAPVWAAWICACTSACKVSISDIKSAFSLRNPADQKESERTKCPSFSRARKRKRQTDILAKGEDLTGVAVQPTKTDATAADP